MQEYNSDKDVRLSRYSTNEIFQRLAEQIAAVLTYTASVARRMELGLSEIAALEHLQLAGELTPTQLGARLVLSSGATTALIDRLEQSGFVERVRNPHDRRSLLVRTTQAGAERAVQHLAPLAADLQVVIAELQPEERAAVVRFMEAVTATLGQHMRGR